jgi:hypothetical protein
MLLGDPLARFKVAGASLQTSIDPAASGRSGFWFFSWPVQNLFFCKPFGVDLGLLLVTGTVVWKRLATPQRILFTTTFLVWLWLGYGSIVPWAYKPLYRQFHYYSPLSLGIAALLPFTIGHVFASRQRFAQGLVGVIIAVHCVSLAAGGRWGAPVDVSRELLRYAQQHRHQRFLTDVATINHMYTLGGFQLPENVVCLNVPQVKGDLLVNKEPPGTPKYRFPEGPIDGILVNLEQQAQGGFEKEFADYLKKYGGGYTPLVPMQYRLLFTPVLWLVGPKDFMVQSLGGGVYTQASQRQ